MQQRQPRVGDIVDDYCPRERRVSDHAVVAMVVDEIRQTRCTTCDTEHEYRQAKVPPSRKKTAAVLPPKPPAGSTAAVPRPPEPVAAFPVDPAATPADPIADLVDEAVAAKPESPVLAGALEGPVHRRLIRAVLPRIEGEIPARQAPEFTMHRTAAAPQPHGRHPRAHGAHQQRPAGKGASANARHAGSRHGGPSHKGPRSAHGPQGHSGHGGGRHGRPHGSGQGNRRKH